MTKLANDLAGMLEGLRKYRSGVAEMLMAYEASPVLNELQPASFSGVLCGSLDEFLAEIDLALEDWQQVEEIIKELESFGFDSEFMGGGCIALSSYPEGGGRVLVTGSDGSGLPTSDCWMVGAYGPGDEEEAIWTLSSNAFSWSDDKRGLPGEGFVDAVRAALATVKNAKRGEVQR